MNSRCWNWVGVALAMLGLTVAPLSAAQAAGWYLGAGIGTANSGANGLKLDTRLSERGHQSRSMVDDTDVSLRVFGGLQLTRHLGVELEYADLGDVTSRTRLLSGDPARFAKDLNALHPVSASALSLSGTFSFPIAEGGDLLLRAGVLGWRGEVLTGSVNGQFSDNEDASGTGYLVGAALSVHNDVLGFRFGYDHYRLKGDGDRPDQGIDVFHFSLLRWFGLE